MWHYRFVTYEDSGDTLLGVVEIVEISEEGEKQRFGRTDPLNPFGFGAGNHVLKCTKNTLKYLKQSLKKYGVVTLDDLDKELGISGDKHGN